MGKCGVYQTGPWSGGIKWTKLGERDVTDRDPTGAFVDTGGYDFLYVLVDLDVSYSSTRNSSSDPTKFVLAIPRRMSTWGYVVGGDVANVGQTRTVKGKVSVLFTARPTVMKDGVEPGRSWTFVNQNSELSRTDFSPDQLEINFDGYPADESCRIHEEVWGGKFNA